MKTKRASYVKYIASMLLFGSNGIVADNIELTSYCIVLLRTLIGSALLVSLFLISGRKFTFVKHPKDVLAIGLSGVAMGTSWMLLYEAYAQVGVSIATLLYYFGPMIAMLLSPMLFKERLTVTKLSGFVFSIVGLFLINGMSAEKISPWGIVCGLLSAATYAVMVTANKKSEKITGMENSLIQLVVAFVTVSIFVGIKNGGYAMSIKSEDILWIMLLGIVNTGVGCYIYFSTIGELPVQSVAICGYAEPRS